MKKLTAKVVAVYSSDSDGSTSGTASSIQVELDGVVGDSHRSFERKAWAGGDKQPEGTVRRNERQWSAVSIEELAEVSAELDLTEKYHYIWFRSRYFRLSLAPTTELEKNCLSF